MPDLRDTLAASAARAAFLHQHPNAAAAWDHPSPHGKTRWLELGNAIADALLEDPQLTLGHAAHASTLDVLKTAVLEHDWGYAYAVATGEHDPLTPDPIGYRRPCKVTCDKCGHSETFTITAPEPVDEAGSDALLTPQLFAAGWRSMNDAGEMRDHCPRCTPDLLEALQRSIDTAREARNG